VNSAYTYPNEDASITRALWPVVVPLLPALPCQVLELGCGDGAFAAELVRLGHAVTGLDALQSGIDTAKKREPRASFHCRNIYEPTPAEWVGQFDVVISLETIEHLSLPGALLERSLEALRPGGSLIVSTPYHGYLKNLALALTGSMDRHFTTLWDHGHVKFFSKKTLGELVRRGGLEGIRFLGCGRVPFLWKSIVVVATKPGL